MDEKDLSQQEDDSIITLVDENGEEIAFEYMDCIEYQGKEYLCLLPVDESDAQVVILEVEPVDEDTENYLAVEDEQTLEAVYAIFKDHFKGVLTFED